MSIVSLTSLQMARKDIKQQKRQPTIAVFDIRQEVSRLLRTAAQKG